MAVVLDGAVAVVEVTGIAVVVTEALVTAGQIITHRAVIESALMIMADKATVDITTINVGAGGRIISLIRKIIL